MILDCGLYPLCLITRSTNHWSVSFAQTAVGFVRKGSCRNGLILVTFEITCLPVAGFKRQYVEPELDTTVRGPIRLVISLFGGSALLVKPPDG